MPAQAVFTLRMDVKLAGRLDRERRALAVTDGFKLSRSKYIVRVLKQHFDTTDNDMRPAPPAVARVGDST
jgi:hypothetical protein